MRPLLMTRFCVFYSLEAGVVCLCIASIVVSGGLICNHKFQVPIQIREWRNQTIYTEENLKIVDLFDDISVWVLVGDVLFTLLMLFPAALTKRETPWEKRNSARKILIPCIVIKILVILYHMVLFVWVAWKLHAKCPEIIGILLAFALYVLLGWYLIVVVISFYFELGMRLTFHKLQPSARSSVQQSQKSSISQQEQAVVSDEKIQIEHIEEDGKESLRKIDNDDNGYSNDMYFKKQKETTYKSSNRTLDDQDRNGDAEAKKSNERRHHKNPEKRSHSSQEIIDGKRYPSTERLKSIAKDKEVEDREEQYRKLLNKSQVSLDSLDGRQTNLKKEKGRSQEKFQQLGPDNMKYRVSERKNADGEGKRRYYYKTDKKGKQENNRRESEDSHDSKERRPAPPKYRSPRHDSEDSRESQGRKMNKKPRSPPHRESDGSHESQSRQRYDPPRNRPRKVSDDSQVSQRQFRYPPPPVSPPHRESDHSHDSQNQGRTRYPPPGQPERDASDNEEGYKRSRDAPPQYYDRRPYYNRPRYDDDDDDDDDYDGQASIPLRSTHTRPEIEERSYQRIPRYEDDDSHYDDRGYNDRREGHDYDDADSDEYPERYGKVPPYRDTVDEDGYISSEV
eukprot:Seg21.5 transcript_id=Seg21.5/GoldUCD/mRNA.D3Y31 product="hypothetical protein" protein_id=Seg21.5/GoldUCD/D3Y31